MDFVSIKTENDIQYFLDKTNALHDGNIISVQYTNNGITKNNGECYFSPEETKLILKILVTSILDTVVEIEFDNLLEWKISDKYCSDILGSSIFFNENGFVVWVDDFLDGEEYHEFCSYAVAGAMRWRIVE